LLAEPEKYDSGKFTSEGKSGVHEVKTRLHQVKPVARGVGDAACVRLRGIYHDLIRYWAEL
jgi:predicted 2-oxoglutarate/Fe(II)-dependent dioxygenase YbiX